MDIQNTGTITVPNSTTSGVTFTPIINASGGQYYTDQNTNISVGQYSPWIYPEHFHNFFVAHRKEIKIRSKEYLVLFLICTSCGEARKIEIPS